MTDITELALREKFEAWVITQICISKSTLEGLRTSDGYRNSTLSGRDYNLMWNLWKAAGAELVEALEKAQQERDNWRTSFDNERFRADKLKAHIDEMTEERTASINELSRIIQKEVKAKREAEQCIAELESRTVTVKQGEVLVTVSGFTGSGKSAIAGEIEIAMKAIGVLVTWANGDSEKRMTGADWLTAIEMYKPTVRIVEVNIPRHRWHQGGG